MVLTVKQCLTRWKLLVWYYSTRVQYILISVKEYNALWHASHGLIINSHNNLIMVSNKLVVRENKWRMVSELICKRSKDEFGVWWRVRRRMDGPTTRRLVWCQLVGYLVSHEPCPWSLSSCIAATHATYYATPNQAETRTTSWLFLS